MTIPKRGPAVVQLRYGGGTLDLWYDRGTRCWVLQHKDEAGNQIGPRYGGEAAYVHSREEAVEEMQEILNAQEGG